MQDTFGILFGSNFNGNNSQRELVVKQMQDTFGIQFGSNFNGIDSSRRQKLDKIILLVVK